MLLFSLRLRRFLLNGVVVLTIALQLLRVVWAITGYSWLDCVASLIERGVSLLLGAEAP